MAIFEGSNETLLSFNYLSINNYIPMSFNYLAVNAYCCLSWH